MTYLPTLLPCVYTFVVTVLSLFVAYSIIYFCANH